jgi:hypothetical protein
MWKLQTLRVTRSGNTIKGSNNFYKLQTEYLFQHIIFFDLYLTLLWISLN